MLIGIDDLPTACVITDEHGGIVGANRTMLDLTGRQGPDLLGQNLDVLLTAGARVFVQTHVFPTLRKDGEIHEIYVHLKAASAHRLPLYLNARRNVLPEGVRYLWLFFSSEARTHFEAELIEARKQAVATAEQVRDAHERLRLMHIQLQEQASDTEARYQSVADLAYKDGLTQLGNRRSLQAAASALMSGAGPFRRFSVLMIDIDHFKQINDRHGHSHGDEVLKSVANCLLSTARQGDTAIRYGGEEFTLVLPGADAQQALRVAERMHRKIRQLRVGETALTVSIGLATANDAFDDLFSVLKDADAALYAAKRQGRNRSVHHKRLTANA